MSISGRIGAGIPERRAASMRGAGVALALLVLLQGCAAIKDRLPRRSPADKPPSTVVTPSRPVPKPPAEPASEFLVIAPATYDRDRAVVRQALAKSDADALASADVGYYLDTLQGRLRQVVGSQGRVTRRSNALVLDLSPRVRFVPGEAPLGPGAAAALAPLTRLLDDYRSLLVAVRVNADTATADGARLAQQRAFSLARALAESGIPRRRIVVYGNTAGRSNGARVEVLLEPIVRGTEAK